MQSLAAPTVAIAHGGEVLRFTKRSGGGYDTQALPISAAAEHAHQSVFETGTKLALVPERLYRFEDRRDYLAGAYPTVSPAVGVAAVGAVGALAVFEHDRAIPAGADVGHHLVQLLVNTGEDLRRLRSEFALAFFLGTDLWLMLYREGNLALAEGKPYRGEADAIFHVASRMQHFGLDRAQTPLFLAGAIAEGGTLDRQLGIYFDTHYLDAGLDALAEASPSAGLLLAFGQALRDRLGALTPKPNA